VELIAFNAPFATHGASNGWASVNWIISVLITFQAVFLASAFVASLQVRAFESRSAIVNVQRALVDVDAGDFSQVRIRVGVIADGTFAGVPVNEIISGGPLRHY